MHAIIIHAARRKTPNPKPRIPNPKQNTDPQANLSVGHGRAGRRAHQRGTGIGGHPHCGLTWRLEPSSCMRAGPCTGSLGPVLQPAGPGSGWLHVFGGRQLQLEVLRVRCPCPPATRALHPRQEHSTRDKSTPPARGSRPPVCVCERVFPHAAWSPLGCSAARDAHAPRLRAAFVQS